MTARPIGPQPTTMAGVRLDIPARRTACRATAIGSVRAAISGRQTVRHRQHQRFLDQDKVGIAARGGRRQPDGMDGVILSHQRKGDHRAACGHPTAASRPVLGDFPDELVAEDDVLIRAHEAVVAGLHHDGRQLIAGPAGVEVRSADPALEHPQEHLAPGWFRIR